MGITATIIKPLTCFVKSFIKVHPLFLIIPILLIGIILFLKRSRSWRESFADMSKILKLLLSLATNIIAIFLGLFVRDFQKKIGDVGV